MVRSRLSSASGTICITFVRSSPAECADRGGLGGEDLEVGVRVAARLCFLPPYADGRLLERLDGAVDVRLLGRFRGQDDDGVEVRFAGELGLGVVSRVDCPKQQQRRDLGARGSPAESQGLGGASRCLLEFVQQLAHLFSSSGAGLAAPRRWETAPPRGQRGRQHSSTGRLGARTVGGRVSLGGMADVMQRKPHETAPDTTLVKYLVSAGAGSRRHVVELVVAGKVRVNGEHAESITLPRGLARPGRGGRPDGPGRDGAAGLPSAEQAAWLSLDRARRPGPPHGPRPHTARPASARARARGAARPRKLRPHAVDQRRRPGLPRDPSALRLAEGVPCPARLACAHGDGDGLAAGGTDSDGDGDGACGAAGCPGRGGPAVPRDAGGGEEP